MSNFGEDDGIDSITALDPSRLGSQNCRRSDPKDRVGFSDYVLGGRVVFEDVIKFYYDQTNKMLGTDFEPPK